MPLNPPATDTVTADASKLSSQIKSDIPGKEKEAEKKGEALASQAGQKFDKAVTSPLLFLPSNANSGSLPMQNQNSPRLKPKPKI